MTFWKDCILLNFVIKAPAVRLGAILLFLLCLGGTAANGREGDRVTSVEFLVRESDHQAARVEFLCDLASEWSVVDRASAAAVLTEALRVAEGLYSEPARQAALELRNEALFWPELKRAKALWWVNRTLKGTRPTRPLLRIAEAWAALDPPKAKSAIMEALRSIRLDRWSEDRDIDLRALAVLAGPVDMDLAENLVALIKSPALKVWAWRSLGRQAAEADPAGAVRYYDRAFQAVSKVQDPERQVWSAVRVAEDWSHLDLEAGGLIYIEAARLAANLEDESSRAAALGFLGGSWGRFDYRKAFEMASLIPAVYPEARYYLFTEAARGQTDREASRSLLEAALGAALKLEPGYERGRALGEVAVLAAGPNQDLGIKAAGLIDFENRVAKSMALASLAEAVAADDPEAATELARGITEPYIEGRTWCRLAALSYERGDPLGLQRLDKAEQIIKNAPSGPLWLELAKAWAGYSGEKALDIVSRIRSPAERSKAYAQMAEQLEALGRPALANEAWESALLLAGRIESGSYLGQAGVLKDLAQIRARTKPSEAAKVFRLVYQSVAG